MHTISPDGPRSGPGFGFLTFSFFISVRPLTTLICYAAMLEAGASSSSTTIHRERSRSRSHSPENSPDPDETESRMADSLYRANATIDEYTTTLAKISRAPMPDDPELLRCCCGRADCDNASAWFAFKNKLEGRLILCAGACTQRSCWTRH